jgi:hypothetical protein
MVKLTVDVGLEGYSSCHQGRGGYFWGPARRGLELTKGSVQGFGVCTLWGVGESGTPEI